MTDEQHVSDDDDGHDEYDMASGDVPMGIRSGFSVRTRRPFVELMVGNQHIEMPVKTAMELAWSMVFAATAGISEAAGIEMAGGEKLTTDEVGVLLNELAVARNSVNEAEDLP